MNFERFEFKDEPAYKVGYSYVSGNKNKYDLIAFDNGALPTKDYSSLIFPVPSGLKYSLITKIEKEFRAKKESGIHAWRSDMDYSDNYNFDTYWESTVIHSDMFYELADLIDDEDMSQRIKLVFDEYDHMQFYICGKGEHEICI